MFSWLAWICVQSGHAKQEREGVYRMFDTDRALLKDLNLPVTLADGTEIRSLRLIQGYKSNLSYRKITGEIVIHSDSAKDVATAKKMVQNFICSDHHLVEILRHRYEFNPYLLFYRSAYGARYSHIVFEFHLEFSQCEKPF